MVIKDIYSSEKKPTSAEAMTNLAPPGDRLLAGFLDLLFHTPVFTLLSSLVVYRLNLLKATFSTTSEKMAVFAQLIWIVIIGSVILQGIYFKIWKKTPGMRLMKLELRSLNQHELTWGQCLLRSTVWCFELCMLGLPLLEIFSHPKRQAIHDRISESEVVTRKSVGAMGPLPAEKSTVQFIYMTVLMLMLGWMTAFFSSTQNRIVDGSISMTEWRENDRLCSQVDEVGSYSRIDLNEAKARLDFATSLYMLEQIDEDCFRQEVDFAIMREASGPVVWVGRALLSGKHTDEQQKYQAKACAEASHWCPKSLYQQKGPLSEANEILKVVSGKKFDQKELAYKTSALILLNRLGAAAPAEKIIESLQGQGVRATGLVAEQLKTVGRTNPDRIPSVLATLKSVMVEKDYLRLNSEICLHRLESGCGGKAPECEIMSSMLPSYKESLEDLVVSRALFKSSLCKKDLMENMEYWTLVESEGLQRLLRISLQVEKEASRAQGLTKLRNFVVDESQKVELRLDALQLLLSRSNYPEDWKLATYLWNRLDWTQASFLAASEWLIRQGSASGKMDTVLSLKNTFSAIPGLKLDWGLLQQKNQGRLPANAEGIKK